MAKRSPSSWPPDPPPTGIASQRVVLGGLGAGLVAVPTLAAAVSPAAAQTEAGRSAPGTGSAPENPVTEYPRLPFKLIPSTTLADWR
jgi:hypothetical protein